LSALDLERLPGFDAARDDWIRLAERTGNVFSTWEWAEAWWRHLGGGELVLYGCRRPGGELAAILPLHVGGPRPAPALRFLGHGPADELGPVCDPSDRNAVGEALGRLLDDVPERFAVFVAERLAPGWTGHLPGRFLRSEPSPVLPIEGRTSDEYLAGRSRNFREQVRRRERKLAKEHPLDFRLSDDPARVDDDLTTLFRLHDARWGGKGGGAFAGSLGEFHREFAARALERGWLRLWMMEIDGRPAAAWYGLRYAGVESYYQAGRDPSLDEWSPGFVLLAHSIRAAFDDGMREYRFLLGDEPFKGRFAERDDRVDTLTLARGLRGRLAVGAARTVLAMPPRVRRRLRPR
jgi:CelD/BcsL family acetyltransferase involved in cellulose biosynthesis